MLDASAYVDLPRLCQEDCGLHGNISALLAGLTGRSVGAEPGRGQWLGGGNPVGHVGLAANLRRGAELCVRVVGFICLCVLFECTL